MTTEEDNINELLYFSLGSGGFIAETRFSVMSAARFRGDGADWRIVVYTDQPELYDDLPVELRHVNRAWEEEWIAPHRYVFRFKMKVLGHSLGLQGTERSALVDGDTYFVSSPEELFRRIGPGRSVMHLLEGHPAPRELNALSRVLDATELVDSTGASWNVARDEVFWNSGVVGMHRADLALSAEAIALNDQMIEHGFAADTDTTRERFWHDTLTEMVAHTVVLGRRTRLQEVRDLVVHYWPSDMSNPFQSHLERVMSDTSLTPEEQFTALWPHRPRPNLERRAKRFAKRLLWKAGLEVGRPGG